jgi:hypothetical protein
MVRRKGELSPAGIDRGWPHQVVLPARFCERGSGYKEIHEFCADLTLCARGYSLYRDGQWFHGRDFWKRSRPLISQLEHVSAGLNRGIPLKL